jgi:peroxiredoxin
VSVDSPAASRRLKQRLKSRFTFLADPEGVLLDRLGIRHRAGRNDGKDIAYPTAVLVDAEGVVRWIFQSGSYRERARAEEIFAAIAMLRPQSKRAPTSDSESVQSLAAPSASSAQGE